MLPRADVRRVPSYDEAVELARIFYPGAADQVRRRGRRHVPFEVLGINPPRDLAFKVLAPMRLAQ